MKSYEIYTFTLRNHIKLEPRISQERIYLEPKLFELIINYNSIINNDFVSNDIKKIIKLETNKLLKNLPFFNFFSNKSFHFKCLNSFQKTYEGWYNLILKT